MRGRPPKHGRKPGEITSKFVVGGKRKASEVGVDSEDMIRNQKSSGLNSASYLTSRHNDKIEQLNVLVLEKQTYNNFKTKEWVSKRAEEHGRNRGG